MIAPMGRLKDDGQETAVGQRIASNIQKLLKAKGWTQGQLAYKAGLTQAAISQLAMGRRRPSIQSVYQIATAFEIPMEEFAGFKPLQIPEAPPEPKDARLESLEERFDQMQGQLKRLTDALGEYVEQRSPQKSHGRQKRAS